ncbi:MAG: hypothetical protein M0Q43_05455 [Methanothrix sp.]|nr:hypothetical protein [Methanothrix sp.]
MYDVSQTISINNYYICVCRFMRGMAGVPWAKTYLMHAVVALHLGYEPVRDFGRIKELRAVIGAAICWGILR